MYTPNRLASSRPVPEGEHEKANSRLRMGVLLNRTGSFTLSTLPARESRRADFAHRPAGSGQSRQPAPEDDARRKNRPALSASRLPRSRISGKRETADGRRPEAIRRGLNSVGIGSEGTKPLAACGGRTNAAATSGLFRGGWVSCINYVFPRAA